jgi:hypothetical protein
MKISYIGTPMSANREAEAALQLLRLQPFHSYFSECRLAIERLPAGAQGVFAAQLEIFIATRALRPMARCIRSTASAAILCVFDRAILMLRALILPRTDRGG